MELSHEEVADMPAGVTTIAPRLVERPPLRMAVIDTVGDPDIVGGPAVGSLYGAVMASGVTSGALRARWPNAHDHENSEWLAHWALPVPDDTPEPGGAIRLETWYGCLVAEILNEGPLGDDEVRTVRELHRFIADCGYEIAGPAEEEYVSRPGEEPRRTILRYEVRAARR
jgi:hypothetical protein